MKIAIASDHAGFSIRGKAFEARYVSSIAPNALNIEIEIEIESL